MPDQALSQQQGYPYLLAWKTLGNILRDGGSWSGHERNCCFLNTGGPRFADVSAVVGLDQDADSRAIAAVDWDQDGDLDLWVSNRTAPRVRFLRNDLVSENRFLALRLQGTNCNRDAIGARVTLETMDDTPRDLAATQTVRAGNGYLAQSSKWLHFGVSQNSTIQRVTVRWPDGQVQTFPTLKAGRRYLLVQGNRTAVAASDPPRSLKLAASTPPRVQSQTPSTRLIPHRRLPLPSLPLVDFQGRTSEVGTGRQKYVLATLWATWCPPCLAELQEFDRHQPELAAASVRWLPINVDDYERDPAERAAKVQRFLKKADLASRGALATTSLVECLDVVQRTLTTKQDPLPVPCSFLLDSKNHLMAMYKGVVLPEKLLRDLAKLSQETADPRDHAVPFPGRWGTGLFPPDWMAIPTKLVEISRASEAFAYLNNHVSTDQLSPAMTVEGLSSLYAQIGRQLVEQGDLQGAVAAFEKALEVKPMFWDPHAGLAAIYHRQGRLEEAVAQHRLALRAQPGHPLSANNMAWILATCPDPKIRKPTEAVRLAQELCRSTNYAQPTALDTLAAAQAAAGQFPQAIETAQKAVALASSKGQAAAAERMRRRLKLYESGRPFFDDKVTK